MHPHSPVISCSEQPLHLIRFLFCFLSVSFYSLFLVTNGLFIMFSYITFSQFEGAFLSDGKGLSNWDVFTHKPG